MGIDLAAGVMIGGRYRLERRLGQGGMGEVWAATHTITRRQMALKFVRGPAQTRPELRRRFLREARAASAVHHPNVLGVIDVFELDAATPVMVMDLLRGETLREKLAREAPLSMAETASVMLPVVSAVGTAHAMGIVHRDLKPENVFLAVDEEAPGGPARVMVLDFGIAKLTAAEGDERESGAITDMGAMVGTPGYMSPEQALGERDIDARADAWAIGVMLYEALSGGRPIEGDSVGQLVARMMGSSITPLQAVAPGVPDDVAALVARLLSRDRARRPEDLREVMVVLGKHTALASREFGPAVPPEPSSAPGEATEAAVIVPRGRAELTAPTVPAAPSLRREVARRGGRGRWAALATASLVVVAAATAATRRAPDPHGVAQSPSGAMTASASAAPYERPVPRSTSLEALAYFKKAVKRLHDGQVSEGHADLARALKADPSLAAAHVPGIIHEAGEMRAAFRAASALRDGLDDRDRGVVEVAEALHGTRRDTAEAERRAQVLAARYPKDPELVLLQARVASESGDPSRAADLALAAFDLDPSFASALIYAADCKGDAGDHVGRRALIDRCVAELPRATTCITHRGSMDDAEGHCAALEQSVRRRLDMNPDEPRITAWLAWAMEGRGAPDEAVLDVIGRSAALYRGLATETDAKAEALGMLALFALVRGDLATSRARATELDTLRADRGDESAHLFPAYVTAYALEESGDSKAAGQEALAYLRRRRNFGEMDDAAPFLFAAVAYRAGVLSRSDALAIPTVAATSNAPAERETRRAHAAMLAAVVGDGTSAREALSAAADLGESGRRAAVAYELARAHALLGEVDGAIALVEPVARACNITDDPVSSIRSTLLLGTLRQEKGDRKGACDAYARVLTRWGNAKPRSVTAEKARARVRALGCPRD